jgi:hypothetical protein
LSRARQRAQKENTSIDALVRNYLEIYAGVEARRQNAIAGLIALSKANSTARDEHRWTRDDLYDR